jgi:hypothetical protein
MIIDSRYEVLYPVINPYGVNSIKNEPMLFNCDMGHARDLGGPITREVLSKLPDDWQDVPVVVDSRVHMLMPGWYPCIPGWHHDDVPRTRADGQPNYGPGQCRSEHIFALVNGNICPTAIATGAIDFVEPELGKVIYREWHPVVERWIACGLFKKEFVPSNRLIKFDDRTWHTGTPAVENGWRFFIRISRYFSPDGKPIQRGNERTNEVRRQVQVYMDNPNDGW